jgi:hypothetical protein
MNVVRESWEERMVSHTPKVHGTVNHIIIVPIKNAILRYPAFSDKTHIGIRWD